MSTEDIQAFLNSKMPNCDTWGTKPHGGTTRANYGTSQGNPPPYTCLRNFSTYVPARGGDAYCLGIGADNKSVATIIYEVSKSCGISAKVLLVMLEKEQGLVTDDWPWNIQYRAAMGYGCPDTAPCDAEYYGFFNQVYNAARQMKVYAQNQGSFRHKAGQNNHIYWSPNIDVCGGSNVFIHNKATAGLYNYTPYQPNAAALNNMYGPGDGCSAYGNRNFWRNYNDWFGSTLAPFSIMKKTSTPEFYLYDGTVKYIIPTWEIYMAYGYDRLSVFILSDSYVDGIPYGGALTNLSRGPNGVVYLNALGKRYSLSGEQCANWNLDCFNPYALHNLSSDALGLTPSGGALRPLMEHGGTVYKMIGGKKQPFLSYAAMAERGYSWDSVTSVENMNAQQQLDVLLPHQGAAMKFGSSSAIYMYANGSYYNVPDYGTFKDWRVDKYFMSYSPGSSYDSSPPVTDGSLSSLIETQGIDYFITGGVRVDITSASSEWPNTTTKDNLEYLVNRLPYKKLDAKTSFKNESGAIFVMEDSEIRGITSVDDFFRLGFDPEKVVGVSNETTATFAKGPALLADGSVFKKPGSGRMYVVNGQGQSLLIPTYEHFAGYRFPAENVSNVDEATGEHYQETGSLQSFINGPAQQKYILSTDGTTSYLTSQSLSDTWGIPSSNVLFRNTAPSQQTRDASRFARNNNGAIYYADNGCKRLITTYDKFTQLGGHSGNTMNVFDDFLSSLCNGSDI